MHRSFRTLIAPVVTATAILAPSLLVSPAAAAPYTFTEQDYIEYGIYFSPGNRQKAVKLLTIRFGDIEGWYAKFIPEAKSIPTRKQSLRFRTRRGSVIVNRNDNIGLSITRDTHNEKKRMGTKRLEVSFQDATCTDAAGVSSPCSANLLLTTSGPDKGASRERRILTITTSTGLSFTYRTRRRVAGTPYTPADFRAPVVNNYAWEWRPGFEN
jgi:hypothetical protein